MDISPALRDDVAHASCCQPAAINIVTLISNLGEHLRNIHGEARR